MIHQIKEDYETIGDLGEVAAKSRANQKTLSFVSKPKPLTVRAVLEVYIKYLYSYVVYPVVRNML
jgi:ATP-dependent DNA ligase